MGTPLLKRHCKALANVPPMTQQEIDAHLADVPGWVFRNGAIERTFKFKDFHQTIGFVNALAWIANREDHHPNLAVGYDRCGVRFNTHSIGGLSINDFICAAKVDALGADAA
jgi:4a-hydroxytetrahydrobiopterin dehydratase